MTQISSIREIQRWSMDFTKIAETLNLQFEELVSSQILQLTRRI